MTATMKLPCLLAFTLCMGMCAHTQNLDGNQETYVKAITRKDFSTFSQKPDVTIIYFLKKDVTPIQNFLEEYEKSAKLLQIYNLELAKLDCLSDDTTEAAVYCDVDGTEDHLYAFRAGHELLALALENTFDVNSIMSNVLQIALLREVPIFQTELERIELEEANKGKYDMFFSYQSAIGTYEHRVLMEIAFAYQHKYKFAITTEGKVYKNMIGSGTGESAMLWFLRCKKAVPNVSCDQVKVADNFDLVSLTRYLKALDINFMHDVAIDGVRHQFDDYDLHKVFFYYSRENRPQALKMADLMKECFYGVIGVVLVDVEHPQAAMFGYTSGVNAVPGVSVLLRGTHEPVPMVTGRFIRLAVENFIGRVLESTLRTPPLTENDRYMDTDTAEEKLLAAVEKQDDQVAEAVSQLSHKELNRTFVPALTDVTFTPETTTHPLRIVLFYLTFDARSMAFLHSYIEASHVLAVDSLHPLAAVDCFDWTDVCSENNITSYPAVRVYQAGRAPYDYSGMLGADPVVALAKLLSADAPVSLNTHQEATLFLEGAFPTNFNNYTDVSVLGLFSGEHTRELAAFKEAAVTEHGQTLYGYLLSDGECELCARFDARAPAVIVYKRHDKWDMQNVYQGPMTSSKIVHFVKEHSLASFPELTSANFPAYFGRKLPFVLLFDTDVTPGKEAHAQVAEVVRTKEFPNFNFGWMELLNEDGLPGKVLVSYNFNAQPPALYVVDHSTSFVYEFDQAVEVTSSKVAAWLREVTEKTATPLKSLDDWDWKPLNPGYDFLKMIDDENGESEPNTPESPMRAPKLEIDLSPPGEEEENQAREALQRVHAEATLGGGVGGAGHAHSEL